MTRENGQRPTSETPYTIIVSSCDAYADTWPPFFSLFEKHWPDCRARILLVTESYSGAIPLPSGSRLSVSTFAAGRRPWGARLRAAVESAPTPLVLYLQEDYYFDRPVRGDVVEEMAALMVRRPEIAHIGLTSTGSFPPFTPTSDTRLWAIGRRSRYRISTQAGLWRKNVLLTYVRDDEDVWMLEIFGSRRARLRDELFLTLNRDLYAGEKGAVFHYEHTGIIRGRWHKRMPEIFAENDAPMPDFSKRGFYEPESRLVGRIQVARRLFKKPVTATKALIFNR